MKRVLKIIKVVLITGAILGGIVALLYALLFTRAEVSPAVMAQVGRADPDARYTALVLKPYKPDNLREGNLVLVERKGADGTVLEVLKLDKIEWPEHQTVTRGGRHGASRDVAQAILDMDYQPKFWVSIPDGTNAPKQVRVPQTDIKGQVVFTLKKD